MTLSGACITSWKRFDGREAFLVRPDATFKEGEKINSGLTLAFPQYDNGGLPFDGFAGNLMWDVVHTEVTGPLSEDPAPSITLRCSDTEYTREMWPHKFEMFYKVTLKSASAAALLQTILSLGTIAHNSLLQLQCGSSRSTTLLNIFGYISICCTDMFA